MDAQICWLYLSNPDDSLVRVGFDQQRYMMQRRRKTFTSWVTIVDISLRDFSTSGFNDWAQGA